MYEPGTIIGEKYRLAEQIGQGGMASVWRPYVELEREVAIAAAHSGNGSRRADTTFPR